MADISALGALRPVEPLNLANYAENKKSEFRLPAKGRYTLRAPEAFPSTAFDRTSKGDLSVQIDPTIVGPTNEGFQLRFTRVSAKSFNRGSDKASILGDYLKACGINGELKDEQAFADAAESTANAIYQADLDWEAYHKAGVDVKGMENFPKRADGSYESRVPVMNPDKPTEQLIDEDGRPVYAYARLKIKRFVSAV